MFFLGLAILRRLSLGQGPFGHGSGRIAGGEMGGPHGHGEEWRHEEVGSKKPKPKRKRKEREEGEAGIRWDRHQALPWGLGLPWRDCPLLSTYDVALGYAPWQVCIIMLYLTLTCYYCCSTALLCRYSLYPHIVRDLCLEDSSMEFNNPSLDCGLYCRTPNQTTTKSHVPTNSVSLQCDYLRRSLGITLILKLPLIETTEQRTENWNAHSMYLALRRMVEGKQNQKLVIGFVKNFHQEEV